MLPERALKIAVGSLAAIGLTTWLAVDSAPEPPRHVWVWSVDHGHPRAPDHLSAVYTGAYGEKLHDYHCEGFWDEELEERTWSALLLEIRRKPGVREDVLAAIGIRASGLDERFVYHPTGMHQQRDAGSFFKYERGRD